MQERIRKKDICQQNLSVESLQKGNINQIQNHRFMNIVLW